MSTLGKTSIRDAVLNKPVIAVSHCKPQFKNRQGIIVDIDRHLMCIVQFDDGMYHKQGRINIKGLRAPHQVMAQGVKKVVTSTQYHPSHTLYTPKDFTAEEIARGNPLADMVINGHVKVCKQCRCSGMDKWFPYPCGAERKSRKARQARKYGF